MENTDSKTPAGIAEKQYILGRKEKNEAGSLNIGRYYALDSSLGSNVYIDIIHPHIVLICGKRGYGKSHTIGVFIEEIARLEKKVKNNLGVVVFDTLGIFWTTQFPNNVDAEELDRWKQDPEGFDINLLVPKKFVAEYKNKGIDVDSFSIRVAELSPYHWCQLFDVKETDPLGIILTRNVLKMQSSSTRFSINELLTRIQNDMRGDDIVKDAAENFLTMADSWGIFDKDGLSIRDFVKRGNITILDLSHLPNPVLKSIVATLVSEKIFEERIRERKIHELKKIGVDVEETGMPMVWLAVDEAQLFLPNNKEVLSKDVLINEWMRQGRQPGLSLVLATQRPSALESEVLSHSDIIICHRLTAQEDIDALSRIRPTYMHSDIKESIKKIGDEKGVALIIDDTSESAHIIKIRPRLSWHGGAESLVIEPQ
jgi:DNA helicase HerA-like ATPase